MSIIAPNIQVFNPWVIIHVRPVQSPAFNWFGYLFLFRFLLLRMFPDIYFAGILFGKFPPMYAIKCVNWRYIV